MALSEVNSLLCRHLCRFLSKYHVNSVSCNSIEQKLQIRNYCSSKSGSKVRKGTPKQQSESKIKKRDPLQYFLSEKIQKIMVAITDIKSDKYFAEKKVHVLHTPEYKLLTDDEVALEQERYFRRAKWELQMPPVMNPREEIKQIFSEVPDIADALPHKFGFVDISMNGKGRDRRVVVRDTDGTLRAAHWDERDRWTQIYNPSPGRMLFPPKMFEEIQLEEILPKQNYLYILERASLQYEPDHPDYIRVSQRVFEHMCSTESFDQLRSTRYFGPMSFYFCWTKKIEPLLIDMIRRELLSHGSMLVNLYDNLHDVKRESYEDPLSVIKDFCNKNAQSGYKGQLELAITGYEARHTTEKVRQTA